MPVKGPRYKICSNRNLCVRPLFAVPLSCGRAVARRDALHCRPTAIMLSAQTATLAATTLVAVALAFYLLSTSSPEDPGTAAPPESVPVVDHAPIAAAPAEAVRTKSTSHAPRSAAAPTEPSSRNGQAAAGKPAVPKKKKSEGEEHGGKKRSKAAAAEAKAAADAKAAEAEESKGEPFVNSVISRAILKQPVDLIALANPPAKESRAKGEGRARLDGKGERRKSKAKPISSWGESFQVAMQTLEGSAVDAALRAQQQLTGCLVQASTPGLTLPLTLTLTLTLPLTLPLTLTLTLPLTLPLPLPLPLPLTLTLPLTLPLPLPRPITLT